MYRSAAHTGIMGLNTSSFCTEGGFAALFAAVSDTLIEVLLQPSADCAGRHAARCGLRIAGGIQARNKKAGQDTSPDRMRPAALVWTQSAERILWGKGPD